MQEMKLYNDDMCVLEFNRDAEKKLKDFFQVNTDTSSMNDLQILSHTTLGQFEKRNFPLLPVIYIFLFRKMYRQILCYQIR